MRNDQWNFIFKHYPEFGTAPYEMMIWLYGQVKFQEDMYNKPQNSGQQVDGAEDDYSNKYDKAIGGGAKQTNKKGQKASFEEVRAAQLKKLEELKSKAGPGKTDAEIAEAKIMKSYKDKDVDLNQEGLVEVDKVREPISMVFIGHVDAGKSTICGNLMYMMGVVDARTIEKYKAEAKEKNRDSWWLAYVMDVSDEEKAKGKTVEVGRAQFDTDSKKYTIFDAPGHKNYVPNMIMGAALADVAGLVISARKGEFEAGFQQDGQTREHAQLAKSLGVQKLIVIVNKMDDCKWSKDRMDEIQNGLNPFFRKTGYSEEDIIYVPIAGLTGENIDKPTDKCKWYKGPYLLQILDEIKLAKRYPQGGLRIPVLDKMKDKDLIIHGKVENGTVNLGEKLALMPSGNFCQVLGLLDAKGQAVKYAAPGENVQIRINIANEDAVQRGTVLCNRDSMMPVTEIFEAEIDVLELLDYKPILSKGYNCVMHVHTWSDEITIKEIIKTTDTDDKGE